MTFIFFCFTLLLIVLKLAGVLTLAWPWVLCPILIPLVALLAIIVLGIGATLIVISLAFVGVIGIILVALPLHFLTKD